MAKEAKESKEAKEARETIDAIFGDVDKMNPDGCLLSENTLSLVDEWIDTGSMALNAIISGSLYKGVPRGRITGLQGPSQCGKTIIIEKIMANAQANGYYCVVFDTEVAVDSKGASNLGVDPKRVRHYPVETVEDCRNQMVRLLDNIIKSDGKQKIAIFLDSLGNLASTKELDDAAKNKDASDMGLRAKALKSMMRCLTYKAAKAKVPIVFTNHIYDDPAATNPSIVKKSSGGRGATYLASLLIQFDVKQEKNDEVKEKMKKMFAKKNGKEYVAPEDGGVEEDISDTIAISHSINGVTLSALTVKNRFIPPFLKTELYLNFKTGFDKHAGLLEMAQAFKIVETGGPTWKWCATGESLGYKKDFINTDAFWKELLISLEGALKRELVYNNETVTALAVEVDEIDRIAAETPEV